jgi:hypothetical protein
MLNIPFGKGRALPRQPCGKVLERSMLKAPGIGTLARIIAQDSTMIALPTLSAFPLKPTSVPRRVYKFCDAESETERSEYGAPTTSNRASVSHHY